MLLSVPEILCWLIWFFWQSFSSLWVIKFIGLFKISWGHLSKYFRNTLWIWYNFKSYREAKWRRTRKWCENNTGHFESFYCKYKLQMYISYVHWDTFFRESSFLLCYAARNQSSEKWRTESRFLHQDKVLCKARTTHCWDKQWGYWSSWSV